MIDRMLVEPITVLRAVRSTDRYGDDVLSWEVPDTGPVLGVLQQAQYGSEVTTERDLQSTEGTVFLPLDAPVTGQDRLVHNGQTWFLVGPLAPVGRPGRPSHLEGRVRLVKDGV